MIRYVVTAIKTNGERELAFHKQAGYTYETSEEAEKQLNAVVANNSSERVTELIGTYLEVRPVECYDSGDPKTWYFEKKFHTNKIINT